MFFIFGCLFLNLKKFIFLFIIQNNPFLRFYLLMYENILLSTRGRSNFTQVSHEAISTRTFKTSSCISKTMAIFTWIRFTRTRNFSYSTFTENTRCIFDTKTNLAFSWYGDTFGSILTWITFAFKFSINCFKIKCYKCESFY